MTKVNEMIMIRIPGHISIAATLDAYKHILLETKSTDVSKLDNILNASN